MVRNEPTRNDADHVRRWAADAGTECATRANHSHLAIFMRPIHYRDLIMRAAREPDRHTLDALVAQLIEAEAAKQILRAKGYGATGTSLSRAAAQVPTHSQR